MRKIQNRILNNALSLQTSFRVFISNMAGSRYFVNNYPYDTEEENSIDILTLTQRVKKDIDKLVLHIGRPSLPRRADPKGGLYVGPAGIAYAFFRLSQGFFSTPHESKEYLLLAQEYLSSTPLQDTECHGGDCNCGFLLGAAGVFAVSAAVAASSNDKGSALEFAERYVKIGERCRRLNDLQVGNDEFFVGRAGYLYGALWLNRVLEKAVVPIELMHKIAWKIVQSGKMYTQRHKSPCPLMYAYYDTEYLGAAHGLCAILEILIQVPGFLDSDKEVENTVRDSVNYLLSLQTPNGNFPCTLEEIDSSGRWIRDKNNELVHWCHGAPGVIYLMAAAYLRWKDERYLNSCYHAANIVWHKGLLKKGPGICHGVAGNGYVFLLLYRLTHEKKYFCRAARFAEFLFHPQFEKEARRPDHPFSLYEGVAGTACFLADLIEHDKAAFPFQDVF